MGKRKRENDEREDFDYIVRKIKKLERKIKRGSRRRRHDGADSDSTSPPSETPISLEGDDALPLDDYDIAAEPISVLEITPPPDIGAATSAAASAQDVEPIPSTSATAAAAVLSLSPTPTPVAPEVLEIFGADPSIVKEYGSEIHSDLAVRLQYTATNGLSAETRKELNEKYLIPCNCTLIDAPELNPETRAAISDPVKKRDRGIELKQKQLSRSITCISEAINILISKEEKDTSIIKLLMDASRLLCDHQHQDSITRRNFILFNLKKDIKDQLIKTKVDKLLFGTDLGETLKIAKSISKSGEELKPVIVANRPPTTRSKAAHQATTSLPIRNNLNWKAPPLNRRPPPGNQRSKEPALKSQHASSSRASYRAPPPQRQRRR